MSNIDLHARICELESQVSNLKGALALAEARSDFAEEHILYRVCDWLNAVGKQSLATRIDPRQGDTIRKHLKRQTQQLADDIKNLNAEKDIKK